MSGHSLTEPLPSLDQCMDASASANVNNSVSSPSPSPTGETTVDNKDDSNDIHKEEEEITSVEERIDANDHARISSNSNSSSTDENASNTMNTNSDNTLSPPTLKSKNINLILLYTYFSFSSRSLWNQSTLSAFVYLLQSNDPKYVGILTCIMGVSQLVSSFPSGVLADKYRRDTILKLSAIVGVIAAISTTVAARDKSYSVLAVALSIWGLYQGASGTSISALFADSMMDGDRSKYFTQQKIVQLMGNATGPLSALVIFSCIGNDWTVQECQFVLTAGQLLSLPALAMLFFLSDDYAVVATSSTTLTTSTNVATDENSTDHDNSSPSSLLSNDLETPLLLSKAEEEEEFNDNPPGEQYGSDDNTKMEESSKSTRLIPILISAADLLGGLAAGMSVRYFPIFFLDNLKLTPSQVQITFLASTIFMAIGTQIAQRMGAKIGRLNTAIFAKWIGAAFFLSMIVSYQNHAPTTLVCVLWVLRTAIMNTTSALTKSILMDNVASEQRAKWSALESINMFGWAGSAAFGGYLVDWEGIIFNFYATMILQLVATIPFFFLIGKIPKENNANLN